MSGKEYKFLGNTMENISINKYKALIKLYDQADIINDLV